MFFCIFTFVILFILYLFCNFQIHSANRMNLMVGYFLGAALMLLAAVVEVVWGIDTEGKTLEEISAAEN